MTFNTMFFILMCLGLIEALKKSRICANCRYFISQNHAIYGKCLLFPKKYENVNEYKKQRELIEFLVTGYEKPKENKQSEYYFCSTARDSENMCGKEGKLFENKNYNPHDKWLDF